MQPLDAVRGQEWVWSRPRILTRRWELKAGDALLATLDSVGLLGGGALATTASGAWRLRHVGMLRGRLEVSADGATTTLGQFRPGWFGAGTFECSARRLRWHRDDFLGRRWEFVDEHEHPLVAFVRRPAWVRSTTAVHATDAGHACPELPLLVVLGFQLLLVMQRQAQAGV